MTGEERRAQVEVEIAGDWTRTNGHGCDLSRCLVDPVKLSFEDAVDPSATIDLWLVFEDEPDTRDGYKIVCDDQGGMFGLACRFFSGRDGYLGAYGDTFLGPVRE